MHGMWCAQPLPNCTRLAAGTCTNHCSRSVSCCGCSLKTLWCVPVNQKVMQCVCISCSCLQAVFHICVLPGDRQAADSAYIVEAGLLHKDTTGAPVDNCALGLSLLRYTRADALPLHLNKASINMQCCKQLLRVFTPNVQCNNRQAFAYLSSMTTSSGMKVSTM